MPVVGPIDLGELQDTVRWAYGYFDKTLGASPGSEILFVPGPALILAMYCFIAEPFDAFYMARLTVTCDTNDGMASGVGFADVDVLAAGLGPASVPVMTVGASSYFNDFTGGQVYTDVGLHVLAYRGAGAGTPSTGKGYLAAQYLMLPATF